jgi:hypothetical protein
MLLLRLRLVLSADVLQARLPCGRQLCMLLLLLLLYRAPTKDTRCTL